MTIGIINPRSGNITSVCDSLDRLGLEYRVLDGPQLAGIAKLLLPGQGRFGTVMTYLEQSGWADVLRDWCHRDQPFLGICSGMQVLFEGSDEDPGVVGLGLLPGRVTLLDSPKQPMIGWASVHWCSPGHPQGAAYFVNSYVVRDCPDAIGYTTYGMRFAAAVARGRLTAFQFHPEKSGAWGKELMARCLIS